MLPSPAQNSPWLPVDQGTKSKPPKWLPWLPRAEPWRHTDQAASHGERVGMKCPLRRVELGLFPVMRLPPQGHPSAARAKLRCFVLFPIDLFTRGDLGSAHT